MSTGQKVGLVLAIGGDVVGAVFLCLLASTWTRAYIVVVAISLSVSFIGLVMVTPGPKSKKQSTPKGIGGLGGTQW